MVCPICVVAVGSGVGILREFGIDDLITGLWFGALILSSFYWILNLLEKKKINFKYKTQIIFVLTYLLFIVPLFFTNIIKYGDEIFGVNKFLISTVLGSIIFYVSVKFEKYLKKINKNKVLFYFQKVVIPIIFLGFVSLLIYLLKLIFN